MSVQDKKVTSDSEDVDMTKDETVNTAEQIKENVGEAEDDDEEEEEDQIDREKIKILPQATSEDGTCASFQILEEDHTLGNPLRYIIMKNPQVEFAGYSIPHPSENLLNLRIQTYGEITAVEALQKGLDDLMALCDVVEQKFTDEIKQL